MRLTLTAYGRTLLDVSIMETPDDDDVPDDVTAPLVALGFTTDRAEELPREAWFTDDDE